MLYPNIRFPANPALAEIWKNNLKRDQWTPSKSSKLCSDHFKEDDIIRSGKIVRLKPNAVPTRFKCFPDYMKKVHIFQDTYIYYIYIYIYQNSSQSTGRVLNNRRQSKIFNYATIKSII